ncbi:hypothetical protein [Algoriphagus zhangzhouensis]|uniref:Uncharacterized protein n=1 Tax=Algoriphagus zhangzhouensis TaxID=1073327 RepID=A0A1M7ZFM8_9BACT|nr:hypothetical protein [Algoriphagus zhangzhouensis]TDY45019.1 hypothetical protein A8938_3233 [Algoriphagus zhangzhouensis]SHO63687.1 hypothetical protein SAMN04488108_2852 [Algoriphagus zhangzhouensis]
MRKLISISLLLCFAIYHFGYYAFYYSHQYQIESNWHDKIYSSLDVGLEERIMEVPLAAPYMANQEEFQATNTRFEKDGKYFRAIKQRYQNDTLQIVYVPDTARKTLESTVQQWISLVTDDDFSGENSNSTLLKVFVKDYVESQMIDFVAIQEVISIQHQGFIFSSYKNPIFQQNSPPPQVS